MFVWRKKIERDIAQGLPLEHFSARAERERRRKRSAELQSLARRREERASKKARREEEAEALERSRVRGNAFDELQRKECLFEIEQSRARAAIRIREGRPKPIDLLVSRSCDLAGGVFKGPALEELEELRVEIRKQLDLYRATAAADAPASQRTTTGVEFWDAMLVLCELEISGGRKTNSTKTHEEDDNDVDALLEGRSLQELEALQSHVESQMRTGQALNVEFWETVLRRVPILKAKAHLRGIDPVRLDDSSQATSLPEREPKPTNQEDEGRQVAADGAFLWKPKFTTRVHTAYEWNKYNRTHYDHDCPPPKVVQGYEFWVFYPDLLDKKGTPMYIVEEDGSNGETCIIRFHAGDPYEDVAFRIVNREWELSRKKGFRCEFAGGFLRVSFRFKRCAYRR